MTDNKTALKRAVEMHREFAALDSSLFLEFELVDHKWFEGDNEFAWNTEDNVDDLLDRAGETYSVEAYHRPLYEDEDYLLVFANNGCGDEHYYLFLKENQVEA